MAGPPVAIVRSQLDISAFASGMLGRSTHRRTSSAPPSFASAARMTRTVSFVVRLLAGWGEKITASLHLIAKIAMPIGFTYGLVSVISEAITPAGFAYLT